MISNFNEKDILDDNKKTYDIDNEYFSIPITYIKKKYSVSQNIIDDLELTDSKDNQYIYKILFKPKNNFAEKTIKQWSKYYTDDVDFLKQSQNLYKTFKISNPITDDNIQDIHDEYISYKFDTGFKEKYGFIDWNHLEFLNNQEWFLFINSITTIMSPVLSLFIPIVMLLIPYILLLIQGHRIGINEYVQVLSVLFRNSILTRIISGNIPYHDYKQLAYFLFTILMYIFQIYNHIMTCIRFHYNMNKIHSFFLKFNDYIHYSVRTMELFTNYSSDLSTYKEFNQDLFKHIDNIKSYQDNISKIQPYSWSISELLSLGFINKRFYELYCDDKLFESIMYSFGFHGYIDNICGIQENINNKKINFCKFSKKNNTKFVKSYFCNNDNPVKNDYTLNKKHIITGPNASGKTTLLKTTLFNVLSSQQLGLGYFTSAIINPYQYIHCYLNIPDTTGRDSLFQAEARRCKDILSVYENSNKNDRHFCIFDELYSGTNPYEAEASSFSFIEYISNLKNVDFMMTTHLINLCKNLDKNKNICNYNMNTIPINDFDFNYTYKLVKGISKIKGAVKVLKQLNYPNIIIENTLDYLKKK